MDNTYWNGRGTHQALADKLEALVPPEGRIYGNANKKLEKFRQACNAYYDIFNNGGGNRRREIRSIFGNQLNSSWVIWRSGKNGQPDWDAIFKIVEPIMDQIVLEAAAEQSVEVSVYAETAAKALGEVA